MLRQKAEEIALKLNTEITLVNRWPDQFKKHAGLSYGTMSMKSESVTEEEVGAWKMMGVLPSFQSEYHPKDIFNADE
jgi:hypothetical protein